VLVSSLIVAGKPQDLWRRAKNNEFTLELSDEMFSEFVNVVSRKKFEKYVTDIDVKLFLADLSQIGKFVQVKSKFRVILEDPDDDIIIRAAYDGKADYIVSGDRHLLALKEFKRIKIVTISEMLNFLNSIEDEIKRKESEQLQEEIDKLKPILEKASTEDIVKSVREDRENR
jgi:putative PIN family toxin of toxin-antitoxin system